MFEQVQKINLSQLKNKLSNFKYFNTKKCYKVHSNRGWGSEIRDPKKLIPDPDPGVKKALDPGSATLDYIVFRCSF
jgi:hypothetical protein